MAGGKIIRIVGGNNHIECEAWTVYTEKFTAYAGKGSNFTSDCGTNIGDPKEAPISYHYFEKGWWTDKDDKEIKEAQIGDRVKFHLKMKNIKSPKGKKVNLELREWDDFDILMYVLSFANSEIVGHKNAKEYETINIVSNTPDGNVILTDWELDENLEIVINLLLEDDTLTKMIANDEARDLELFFRCRYIDESNLPEIAELPWETWNYLKVKPKPLVEPIIFVHASDKHPLPPIYSFEDGSPWYIGAYNLYQTVKGIKEDAESTQEFLNFSKNILYTKKYKNLGELYNSSAKEELNYFEKKAYKIAIRKLDKGELVFNSGRKGTTSRFYYLDISDIDSEFKDKIKVGVNRGTGISGETSRGINQLEAQTQRGIAGTIKTVGEIVGVFGVLSDLTTLLRGAADHNVPTPPIIPPFITMEVDRMMKEDDEFIIKHWNIDLQKAIRKGKDFTKDFLEYNDINRSKNLGFKIIDMSEEGITKVLKKEIDAIKDPTNSNSPKMLESLSNIGDGNRDSGLLIQSMESLDKYNRLTIFHYIHAIFVNDLKI